MGFSMALRCSFASDNCWILFIMTSIPMAVEKMRSEESFKARSGAPLATATTPAIVDVARGAKYEKLRESQGPRSRKVPKESLKRAPLKIFSTLWIEDDLCLIMGLLFMLVKTRRML
ncbi:hypothetical protein K1719_019092 [Acacia pycnantha]|nr:hypothetical protein K1719_019092 [Acacia pycnantha]